MHQVILGTDDISNPASSVAAPANPSVTETANTTITNNNNQNRNLVSPLQHPRYALVATIHAWATGVSFAQIMGLTDVMEGTIVRVVTRLDETCREVMSAARLVGDPLLYAKMEKAREGIRRDVCFVASLYM